MNKKNINKKLLFITILPILLIIFFIYVLKDYLSLFNKSIFFLILALILFTFISVILFIYSNTFKHKKLYLTSIFCICLISLICIIFGFITLKINNSLSSIYNDDSYYDVDGYISYNSQNKSYDSIDELINISNLNIGVIKNKDNDYLGKEYIESNYNNPNLIYYEDDFSLFKDLVDNNTLDIALFDKYYKMSVNSNKEYQYTKYLNNIVDISSFKDHIKSNKEDLSNNSFNILLIGYAPENEEETIGLADSIMIATINLDSLSVNFTSVARSSDVKFACAGGIRSKINETITYGKKCLIDTVSDLLDTNINYYVEINFRGVVDIVNAINGIVVDNPVEFVGQTSSALRGTKTILVPAGENVLLDGEQALAFARERNAYSSLDDLQRQLNQQQVLSRIIEKLLSDKNIIEILDVIDVVGDNVKTNISKSQILNILNRILTIKDNTGISLFNKLSFTSRQIVGTYVESYDYYLKMPLWVYRIYDKSINDCTSKINDTLANNYNINNINQDYCLNIFAEYPYIVDTQDIDYSNEILPDENMPNYYPLFIGENLEYTIQWANENNVDLNITYIDDTSDKYDKDKIGQVISQSVQYGSIVDLYKECTIEVIGE